MGDMIQVLRRFLARDLVFLTGGGCVVASFLYALGRLPSGDEHTVFFALLAGIAYVVGYAMQDGFSLLPGFTTTIPHDLTKYPARIYGLFTGIEWKNITEEVDFERTEDDLPPRQSEDLERITVLHQLSSTVGPCALVSCAFLSVAWWMNVDGSFSLCLAVAAFLIGILLSHLAWAKAGQRAQYLANRFERNS